MDKTTWQHYCQTHETYTRQKYPNVPADKIPKPKPIKETANSITTAKLPKVGVFWHGSSAGGQDLLEMVKDLPGRYFIATNNQKIKLL